MSDHAHLFVFSANKAGMEGDKEKQAKVIYEASKNSAFFKQAQAQDDKVNEKVRIMMRKLEEASIFELETSISRVSEELISLEKKRSFRRICVVLDMDMFYAAVEIRDAPHLSSLPVAVGGNSMICTTNYHARKFGVRAAMPGFIGRKLCPGLVFVEPNFDKYTKVAEQIREVVTFITILL